MYLCTDSDPSLQGEPGKTRSRSSPDRAPGNRFFSHPSIPFYIAYVGNNRRNKYCYIIKIRINRIKPERLKYYVYSYITKINKILVDLNKI